MIIILIICFIFYRIYEKKENFLNDKLIGYQQCGNLVNSFPTFLQCHHFKNTSSMCEIYIFSGSIHIARI